MKNKSMILTMSILLITISLMAQSGTGSKEAEVKKDENNTSYKFDLGDFEGKDNSQTGTFTDQRDGKIYKTVIIGTQTWMAENIAYKATLYCWAYNDDPSMVNTYGYLYNWWGAKTACPAGWHLPSDAEWQVLIDFSGGNNTAGGNLKETGTEHWANPNTGATNLNGFAALPGGFRNDEGEFSSIGTAGFWWSSTEALMSYASAYRVECPRTGVGAGSFDGTFGYSVRCIKD